MLFAVEEVFQVHVKSLLLMKITAPIKAYIETCNSERELGEERVHNNY